MLVVLAARFGADAGVTWDELPQTTYGDRVVAWFESGFTDRTQIKEDVLDLYGGLFDGPAEWLAHRAPFGLYETRHLLTAFVALLGIVAAGLTAARVGGRRAGFFAIAMLALTPTWIGHGLFNPKDVPFGTAAMFATYASVRLITGPIPMSWGDAVGAGLAVGAALAVRAGGAFLLAYPCAALACRTAFEWLRRRRSQEGTDPWPLVWPALGRLMVVVPVAWVVMVSAWPWAQLSPLRRPVVAMAVARHFDWEKDVLFRGAFVNAHALPASYLPTWLRITLPETYLLAAVCGIAVAVAAIRRRTMDSRRALGFGMILLSALLPIAAAVVTRPLIYDAYRHFLFVLPPMAAAAAVALSAFLGSDDFPIAVRRGACGAWVALAALVAVDTVALHPYEYVYFNRLSGGLRAADGRFETDYWGASYKEGLAWVVSNLVPASPGRLRVSSCDPNADQRLDYYRRRWPDATDRLAIVPADQEPEVFLAVTRFNCHKVRGDVLHVVERQGVPLLYVIRLRRDR